MHDPDPTVVLTATQLQIIKLRTELSFILSDVAHGGPLRAREREFLLSELSELTAKEGG